ncbi:MAG: DUF899 domain-containing protein [Candidatus Azotimanducaceae bacterium WSBS_2022_MAG_OTU7]
MTEPSLPRVVSQAAWQREVDQLRSKEKALTRATDAVNAQRRNLPMVHIDRDYEFEGETGKVSLLDLFDGRPQLIVYHFMFGPDAEAGCPGCSWVTDAMPHPAHLNIRDTSLVLVSRAPLAKLLKYRERMGWERPWYSSFGSEFNVDMGATIDAGENHVVSVFLREKDQIYRTYYTDNRGVEHLGSHWTYLDLTPFGRQEGWEGSPDGWPKGELHWTARHDEY